MKCNLSMIAVKAMLKLDNLQTIANRVQDCSLSMQPKHALTWLVNTNRTANRKQNPSDTVTYPYSTNSSFICRRLFLEIILRYQVSVSVKCTGIPTSNYPLASWSYIKKLIPSAVMGRVFSMTPKRI